METHIERSLPHQRWASGNEALPNPERIGRLRQFAVKRGRLVLMHELEGIAFKAIRNQRLPGLLAVFDTPEPEIGRCLIAASEEQITLWKTSQEGVLNWQP